MKVCAALCEVVFWGDLRAQEVRLRDDSRLLKTLAVQKLFTPPRKVLRTVQKATGVPRNFQRSREALHRVELV